MRARRTKLMRHAGPYKVVSRVVGEVAVRREGAVRLRPEVQRFAELMEWKLRGVDSLADMTE